jgi:predicted nucleic acid-binding protein
VAQALILDSEAINALAAPTTRGSLALRARAIARVAHERGVLIRVPAAVLAEVCRGARFDAAINQLLNREAICVAVLTRRIAQRAGALLAKAAMPSANAVDAFVVATALEYDSAVIATGDAGDLRRLSASYRQVSLMTL